MVRSDPVAQFCALTGASPDTATFFLESSKFNIEAAVDSYFASGGQQGEHQAEPTDATATGSAGQASSSRPPAARQPAASRNVRGFADLAQGNDNDDEDDHNEYYAGGEKSGQVVRGGPPRGATPTGRIEELFDSARRRGAQDGVADDLRGAPGIRSTGGFAAFAGRPRTLADADASASTDGPAPASALPARQQGPLTHVIVFYTNGIFTVDDGPARHIEDPANAPFLRSIQRGECPQELEPADRSVQVTVNLLRKDEDYVEPEKPRYTAFAGSGRRLTDEAAAPAAAAAAEAPSGVWAGVDESQPTTSLQLRLADGSRMVARFNLTHTVADVRRFIAAARPDMPAVYKLTTAFPSKVMADDGQTIEEAGLANAVLIQI